RHQQRAELLRRYDERLDPFLGVGVDQGRAAGELGHLAHERAGAVGDDRLATIELVAPRDGDRACQDDGQPVTDLADLHEGLTRAIRPELPEAAQPVDLHRLEDREHLLPAVVDQRAFWRRHRGSRRYAGADEVVNLDRGGASKSNGARSLLAAGRQLTVGDGLHRVASLRYDGSAADSEIPSAPGPVTRGYLLACSVVQPSCRRRARENLRRFLSQARPRGAGPAGATARMPTCRHAPR